ncbi:DUF397 domain-containing protein [Streptomyces celluloflavus]|uniref:DUF397 domain-containing protein n=1 Tax=Streptomyces celluloflavus TaxID=58344 RepID=UPI0036DCBEA4
MRYIHEDELTPKEQEKRKAVRLEAAERFARGKKTETATWRKSSYSGTGGNCVEIADGLPGVMPVRDSKNPAGPQLVFGAGAWTSFTETLKTGHFTTS